MGLMRRIVLGDLDLTDYPYGIEFAEDWGTPENAYDTLVSLLADGESVSSSRVSNRQVTLTLLVEGPTTAELAAAESALVLECEKQRSTLTVDPGDDYGAVSVFDIFRVQATLEYDAALEQTNFRRYTLTIPAQPYARGADLVVTPAQGTATETVVFDGTNTTGWSAGGGGGTFSVVSGALRYSYTGPSSQGIVRTAAVSMVGQPYLAFTWKASTPIEFVGFFGQEVARGDAGGGYTVSFVKPFDGSSSLSSVGMGWSSPASGAATVDIDKISTWTALPYIGTARQKALSLIPGGSVRTSGSIHVTHASNALGKAIVYTHPSGTGYLPPLRPWRTNSETVITDTTLVSGVYNSLSPTFTRYRVPVSVLPEGRVELWAWLAATTGSGVGTLSWAISSWMGGSQLSYELHTTDVNFAANNTWYLFSIGVATVPPVRLGPAGYIEVHLHEVSAAKGMLVDEAYLFATDKGSLTVVDCGTGSPAAGGSSNHLWIDAPSTETPNGALYRGVAADRSDAFHAQGYADTWGVHNFEPAGTNVFVVTRNTIDAATSLEHYRRYHTHAAGES